MQRLRAFCLSLLSILSASCGFETYLPSSSEKSAKEVTLSEVKAFEKELRLLIPDLVFQKYPGTQSDYLFFRGNYLAMDTWAEVRYVTNLSGKEACEYFLEYIKNKNQWDTKSHRGECGIRKIHNYLFSSIDARKIYVNNPSYRFSVDIGVKDYADSPTKKYWKERTQIEIWIHRTLDGAKSAACIVERPPEEQPCRHADWYEKAGTQ